MDRSAHRLEHISNLSVSTPFLSLEIIWLWRQQEDMLTFMTWEIWPSLSREGSPHLSTRPDVCVVIPMEQVNWLTCCFSNSQSWYVLVPSMISSLSFIFHTYEFINDLQDMHLALLKGGFQWSFLIYQRLLKLKSMFIMIFLLPLYEVFHSLWQLYSNLFSDMLSSVTGNPRMEGTSSTL